MAKVLIVEDDIHTCTMISEYLSFQKYVVDIANTGTDGREKLLFYKYDVVILDWDLPGIPGIELCRELRARGASTPILMLTGKDTIKEKQEGFETGADDYLTKPFNMQELTMRLMALLRRPATYRSKVLQCRDIVVDTGSRKVTKGAVAVRLFPKDYLLLEFLMLHPNEIFSAEAILDRVWDSGSESSEDAVITSVKRLRKQLDDDGATSIISTIRGAGYRLNSD